MPANSDLILLHACSTVQENTFEEKPDTMEKDLKRKANDNNDGGPKKKKKQWRAPKKGQINVDRSLMTIKAGDAGIWVTCDMHKEGVCTAECKDLFNEYADICYAGWKGEGQGLNKGEAEDETDIEKEISEEITELKTASKEALFQPVKIDIQCDAFESASSKRSRWIKRLTPMTRMAKANEKGLEEVSKIVLAPSFHSGDVTAKKFAIRTTIRNNSTMKRDDVIKQVADAVGTRHSVDLTNYDLLIIVDIYRNILGMSVVASDFEKLKRFNLAEIYSPTPKPEKSA
ncbi:hypothetical protein G7Y79_00016g041310 [Physcia stellaris]|nr:hypothetical protein G7Y79_00016g041310 [Physcia stellaris]